MRAKAILVFTLLLFMACGAGAATQRVLYTFTGGVDGGSPYAGVIFDQAGNLYGVTERGGLYDGGTVFQLSPSQNGWTETVLYSFTGGSDGDDPIGGLAIDEAGNLYGTAAKGGDFRCGTAFKLSPSDSGWTFTVLHTFTGGADGCAPVSNLFYAGNGYMWGTTLAGGSFNYGAYFGLPTAGGGDYVIPFNGRNGNEPWGNVNLWRYGTTFRGGLAGTGNLYHLLSWGDKIKVIRVFKSTGAAGYHPSGDLLTQVVGGVKTMYGTTYMGGVGGRGAVYRLTPSLTKYDVWITYVLHSFSGPDGASPSAGLTPDAAGNLYGTTTFGGTDPSNAGTVFKLTPGPTRKWIHTLLYSFTGGMDGGEVYSGVVLDNAGNLYGTTSFGGAYKNGVVYEITP